ncbi:DUF2283 domain-containing protein [Nitrospira sp. T9]|uniref:DUF2283 domain-containing protein n=1 Tax=unclassified Nitrospira TaxID=2652172 RepID=UPI003F95EECF
MKLSYDAKCNIAYLRLHEKTEQVTTIKVSDEMNIDMAPDGTVYGIELLNANEQLAEDHGALIVEAEGVCREIPLIA